MVPFKYLRIMLYYSSPSTVFFIFLQVFNRLTLSSLHPVDRLSHSEIMDFGVTDEMVNIYIKRRIFILKAASHLPRGHFKTLLLCYCSGSHSFIYLAPFPEPAKSVINLEWGRMICNISLNDFK